MHAFQLRTRDGALLFEGYYPDFKTCVETAIKEQITLDGLDLSGQDLRDANLDDAKIRHADFKNADLTGANLSECILDYSNFSNANMINTCVCYSSLEHCRFLNTSFAATDFAQSKLDHSIFSGPATFTINFTYVDTHTSCLYLDENQNRHKMETTPMVIIGLPYSLVFLDETALINNRKRHLKTPFACLKKIRKTGIQ